MDIVIVDDELSAREILKKLILRFHPQHTIVGVYEDLEQGVNGIKRYNPDLVFLDIEMPEFAGYEIVDFFDEINFKIIFTTAYSEYAFQAFEINATDYLLKPIEIERLAQAVSKVEEIKEAEDSKHKLAQLKDQLETPEMKITYLEKGFTEFLALSDIIALEAQGAYTVVHSKTKNSVLISKNLKQFETEFEKQEHFIRVHRSWIINRKEIIKYSKTKLEIHLSNKIVAKISKTNTNELEFII